MVVAVAGSASRGGWAGVTAIPRGCIASQSVSGVCCALSITTINLTPRLQVLVGSNSVVMFLISFIIIYRIYLSTQSSGCKQNVQLIINNSSIQFNSFFFFRLRPPAQNENGISISPWKGDFANRGVRQKHPRGISNATPFLVCRAKGQGQRRRNFSMRFSFMNVRSALPLVSIPPFSIPDTRRGRAARHKTWGSRIQYERTRVGGNKFAI
jgi:hypothetical protein